MKTKKVAINEQGLTIDEGKSMILKMIDNQINDCKLQFITNWEKNHQLSEEKKNKRINQLTKIKKELKDFMSQIENNTDAKFSFSLNLEVKVEDAVIEETNFSLN